MKKLSIRNLGPVVSADLEFGDLTVFVGPQATGKSIALQLFKLAEDAPSVRREFARFNIKLPDGTDFADLYFGEGMAGLFGDDTEIRVDGASRSLDQLRRRGKTGADERVFYIPAQRVLSLREGSTRPFTDYRVGDPFVLREFSEKLHQLFQQELQTGTVFPKPGILKDALRKALSRDVFGGFDLIVDQSRPDKRLVLRHGDSRALPYLVWSAGQREFVPLLLGLYWLMPAGKVSRREQLTTVIIEELEMGLHPSAVVGAMSHCLELMRRGYRVLLSTHSSQVLDVLWALRNIRELGGGYRDVQRALGLKADASARAIAEIGANPEHDLRVYYFSRGQPAQDISGLDPGSSLPAEAGWGGLAEFTGTINDVIAGLASRSVTGASRR